MIKCQICKNKFKGVRFNTDRIKICTKCVNTLIGFNEPAIYVEMRLQEKLQRGMINKAHININSDNKWMRDRAVKILENPKASAETSIHDWITWLLSKDENSTKDFKILRAARRGIIKMNRGDLFSRPSNWVDIARKIRAADKKCHDCGALGPNLDVHHIIYLSRHGTNAEANLVALCRACHQQLHGYEFPAPPESNSEDQMESKSPEIPKKNQQQAIMHHIIEVQNKNLLPHSLNSQSRTTDAINIKNKQPESLEPKITQSIPTRAKKNNLDDHHSNGSKKVLNNNGPGIPPDLPLFFSCLFFGLL